MALSSTSKICIPTPQYHLAESLLFAHSSRLADAWTPTPEIIIKPALDIDAGEIQIDVDLRATRNTRPRTKNPHRWLASLSTLKIPDKFAFDARFETAYNMAHQIMYVVGPMLLARKSLSAVLGNEPQIHIILRREAPQRIQEIYRILGFPVILTNARVEARFIRISSPFTAARSGGKIIHVASLPVISLFPDIFREASLGETVANLPEKVFISRKKSRYLLNESEISQLLVRHGFQKYYFEDIPVDEQWQVVANARQVVAIHGAAMATMCFNQRGQEFQLGDLRGLQIVELFGAGYQGDLFRRFAGALNARWCAVRGKITPEIVRDLDERGLPRSHEASPFAIDPRTLELALEYLQEPACRNTGRVQPVYSPN